MFPVFGRDIERVGAIQSIDASKLTVNLFCFTQEVYYIDVSPPNSIAEWRKQILIACIITSLST